MADGPAGFTQGFTCPALLRIPLGNGMAARKGLSPAAARLSRRFRSPSLSHHVVLQPRTCRNRSGLGSSPVARRYWGNHCYFLFLPLLRCFSSRRWPPELSGWHASSVPGFPIRTSAGQGSLAPRRGFSQLATSFVACGSLGILRTPFLTSSTPGCHPARGQHHAARLSWFALRLPCFSFLYHFFVSQHVIERFARLTGNVENNGFEPLASCMPCKRSSQLS